MATTALETHNHYETVATRLNQLPAWYSALSCFVPWLGAGLPPRLDGDEFVVTSRFCPSTTCGVRSVFLLFPRKAPHYSLRFKCKRKGTRPSALAGLHEVMFPVLILWFCEYVFPTSAVEMVAGMMPALHPYMAVYLMLVITYIPVGIKIVLLMPAGKYNNKCPRSMADAGGELAKSDFLKRNQSAHDQMLECLPVIAGGVVAALSAGVPLAKVSALSSCCLFFYAAYLLIFISPLNAMTDGNLRTLMFIPRLAIMGQLWLLAAGAATK
ncbi:MAG: hypothetical protein ACPIOQ_16215 [Promethearchaeia archaeon]